MSKLSVAFDVVEKLLSVPGMRVKNTLSKADQSLETDEFRFCFSSASDPRTSDFGNLLETLGIKPSSSRASTPRSFAEAATRPDIIKQDLQSRAEAPLYSFGESRAFQTSVHAAKISEGGLKLLEKAAEQFLARQPIISGYNTHNKPAYRIAVPTGEDANSIGQRILTACHILGLKFSVGHSDMTHGKAIKFDEPETVERLKALKSANPPEQRAKPYTIQSNL